MDEIKKFKSGKVWIPPEKVEQAKSVGLLDYFKATRPGELVRKGKDYCLKDHSSFSLSENGRWNWFSQGIGGRNAIDYLTKIEGLSFQDAVLAVLNEAPVAAAYGSTMSENKGSAAPKAEKKLLLPDRDSNNDKVIEYLHGRGLNDDVIGFFIEKGMIYQTKGYRSVCFVGYDSNNIPRLANIRATVGDFKGTATGSDRSYGFGILDAAATGDFTKGIHLFEAPMDLLSYATLISENGYDFRKFNMMSLSGIYAAAKNVQDSKVPVCLARVLGEYPELTKLYVHFDNDMTGMSAASALKVILPEKEVHLQPPPKGFKDVNDYLCRVDKVVRRDMGR